MMHERVASCCQALRLGRHAEASDMLIPILDSIAEQLDRLPATTANQVQECLARALHCQQTQNLIALADELEYVLLPMVQAVAADGSQADFQAQ